MKHTEETGSTASQGGDGGGTQDRSGAPAPGVVNTSRRRFTQAGLSTSVVMTLASRPAAASYCSYSGSMSGNLSRPGGGPCQGLTPDYWKANPESWGCGYDPGLCNPLTQQGGACEDYSFVTWGELKQAEGEITEVTFNEYKAWANWNGETVDSALPNPSPPPTTVAQALYGSGLPFENSDQTMMQAFWADDDTLIAHASAALLNVCLFGEEGYGYTKDGLIQFIRDWTDDEASLLVALQGLNERP